MILVKDRTGSKNGTADSTLVGVFDSKRPLYRIVKWLILHFFPPVFRLLYGFRVVGRIPEEKMQNGCTASQSCSQAGLRDAGMRVSGLYDAVFIVGI